MKFLNSEFLRFAAIVAGALAAANVAASAQTRLTNQHVDVGVAFEDGAWDLHLHDETNDIEYAPNEAILQLGLASRTAVPANPTFGFLGTAGSPVYVLSQVQNPSLVFLGFAAEEIGDGTFAGNEIKMTLKGVTGPGRFSTYLVDGFGNPQVRMNSGDGVSDSDFVTIATGGHVDFNWAFTEPGNYSVTFEASGTLADGNIFSSSGPQTYSFEVIPEPGTFALVGTGLLALSLAAWRRRQS